LVLQLPRFIQGQPVPVVSIPGIAQEIQGFWSLWQISVTSHELRVAGWKGGPAALDSEPETCRRRIMPLFLADNGKVYISGATRSEGPGLSRDGAFNDFASDEQ
jgi:hypothetical protein